MVCWKLVNPKILRCLVLLAVFALAPVGVPTLFQCPLANVQKKVVCLRGAYDEVGMLIVGAITIYVMNYRSWW